MKVVAIVNARMSSRRLPGKALLPLKGRSVLYHHISRLRSVKGIDEIWLATTKDRENVALTKEVLDIGIPFYRGAEEDIIERYIAIAKKTDADVFIRCGCDKPLFSTETLAEMIKKYCGQDYIYIDGKTPAGFNTEIVSLRGLIETHKYYRGTAITQYIREHPHKFIIDSVRPDPVFLRPEYRIALDTRQDYLFLTAVFDALYEGVPIGLREVFKFLDDSPDIANLNRCAEVTPVNIYVERLMDKPIATIYYVLGKYIFKDRMGQTISRQEAIKLIDRIRGCFKCSRKT